MKFLIRAAAIALTIALSALSIGLRVGESDETVVAGKFAITSAPTAIADIPTATAALIPTASIVPSPMLSHTPTIAPTVTPEPSLTPTPTDLPSATPIPTETPTSTETPTPTETFTPSATFTPTPSATPTDTATPTLTATITPTPTNTATLFIAPPPTSTPTATPTPFPGPEALSGVPLDMMVVMDDETRTNVQNIYACGISRGSSPRAFSKIGDCNSEPPHFLTRFDEGTYNLGQFDFLQPVVNQFGGSFGRESITVHRGFHSWSAFDPMWANKSVCSPRESPIACEFRINKPTIALIRLGTNDYTLPEFFEKNMRKLVEYAIQQGVIPVLGTKADRLEGQNNRINDIIKQIAADYRVPLWDFDLVAQTLPGSGLQSDGFHMTVFYAQDYRLTEALQRGHGLQNISALIALQRVWIVASEGNGTPGLECAAPMQ